MLRLGYSVPYRRFDERVHVASVRERPRFHVVRGLEQNGGDPSFGDALNPVDFLLRHARSGRAAEARRILPVEEEVSRPKPMYVRVLDRDFESRKRLGDEEHVEVRVRMRGKGVCDVVRNSTVEQLIVVDHEKRRDVAAALAHQLRDIGKRFDAGREQPLQSSRNLDIHVPE